MTLPGRTSTGIDYRYGFQGQEKDDELKGEGNSLNYTFRMHDPRVGRFFAVDPLAAKYPHNSPYAFSENKVIDAVELEGLEKLKYTIKLGIETTSDYVWKDIFGTGISWIDFDWNISNDVELISAEVEESKTLSYEVKLKVPVSASLDRKIKSIKLQNITPIFIEEKH
ncbi:MAG: hypothetical protein HC854_06335 [Flavobacterium sp.]|nr:hypothetical protein [Flavobacterium sp.]